MVGKTMISCCTTM